MSQSDYEQYTPLTSTLETFFGDEEDDEGVRALCDQMAESVELARDLRRDWIAFMAMATPETCQQTVRKWAHRYYEPEQARQWLETLYAKPEPLWSQLDSSH